MFDPSRRSLLVSAVMAVPLIVLPGCAGTGGGGVEEGLRRLLYISSERAIGRLVAANGYLDDPVARIGLPQERDERSARVLGALMRSPPVQRALTLAINRAAGEAADRAAPVIYDSIRSLTFADALGIVRGGPQAATDYLERSIGTSILDVMLPEVGGALREFGSDSILGPVLGAATGIDIPAIQQSATRQAAQGLWRAIGREEAAIRADPRRAGDPLVESVLMGSRALR